MISFFFLYYRILFLVNLLFYLAYYSFELNSLVFEVAIEKDKRSFGQYYISLIQTNHILLYIFYTNDFNSPIIKLSIFIFNLSALITINALFFNDDTMHKIYFDHGTFNFVYQLPQIIYSSIISAFLNCIIKFLGLSEKDILKIKQEKIMNIIPKENSILKTIRIKFALFYLINSLFLGIFWHYVTCFCGIYKNTQIHLIKDSLISFGTNLLSPFGIYLIPGLFRILGLTKKIKCFYSFSKIIQLI